MAALLKMRQEDPTWVVEQSKELKQTIVHGQGEFHLRTLKWRLENNEKIPVEFEEPKIPYRETITKQARATYRHKKQSGGAGQFGEVSLIVEPFAEGMPDPTIYKFNGQEFKMNIKGKEERDLPWGGKAGVHQLCCRRCHRPEVHASHPQRCHGLHGERTVDGKLCTRCTRSGL